MRSDGTSHFVFGLLLGFFFLFFFFSTAACCCVTSSSASRSGCHNTAATAWGKFF